MTDCFRQISMKKIKTYLTYQLIRKMFHHLIIPLTNIIARTQKSIIHNTVIFHYNTLLEIKHLQEQFS